MRYLRKFLLISFGLIIILLTLATAFSIHAQQSTSRGGERGSGLLWDGIWSTDYGRMELGQHGNIVAGSYGTENGRIWGTVRGSTLEFEWEIHPPGGSFDSGGGEFTLGRGGNEFTGAWWYSGYENTDNAWDGTRIQDRLIEGTYSEVDYCVWHGSWELEDGAMLIEQDIDSTGLDGELIFNREHLRFSGNASGWTIDIEFGSDNETAGTGHLTLSPGLGTFGGELFLDEIVDPMNIFGSFFSPALRSRVDGNWDLTWGETEIFQDDLTGIISGTVPDANIDNEFGECTIEGVVVGDICLIDWTLTGSETDLNGTARFTVHSGDTISGFWWYAGSDDSSGKLSGNRD